MNDFMMNGDSLEVMQEKYRGILENDPLTGIHNRRGFYSRTAELLREDRSVSYDICCINIDKFKLINDLFGTAAGDQLLIFIGRNLHRFVPERGTFARLTADNFAICIPHRENVEEEVTSMMQKLLQDYPLHIRIVTKCGFYHIHDIEVPVSIMCDRANMAIQEIKGRYQQNYNIYDDRIRSRILMEQEIVNEMNSALEAGQFVPYYQPKFNIETGLLIGSEALVRWMHPEKGMISPGLFIPVFEKNGFIANLDWYIWENVCHDIRSWIRAGYAVAPVSVNVSRAEMYDDTLPVRLKKLLEQYEVPVKYVQLEITETAYTENPDQMIAMIRQFKEFGFTILMDDFGSGYSSLNILKDVPVDVLKLDLKFLYNMDRNRKANYILKSVVQMARRLELSVIAEGVETESQAEFLKSIGCVRAQGFLYAKPMPRTDLEVYLKDAGKVSDSDEDTKIALSNIDDVMSQIHRQDEIDWYRAAMLQLHAMLYEYDIENDIMVIYDMRDRDAEGGELYKMEISGLTDKVRNHGLIHEDERDMVLDCIANNTPQDFDLRISRLSRESGYRWYHMTGKPYYTSDGKPLRMIGVVRDISEDKAEEALLEIMNIVDTKETHEVHVSKMLPAIVKGLAADGIAIMFPFTSRDYLRCGISYIQGGKTQAMNSREFVQGADRLYSEREADENGIVILRDNIDDIATVRALSDRLVSEVPMTYALVRYDVSQDFRVDLSVMYRGNDKILTDKDLKQLSGVTKYLATLFSKWSADALEYENTELVSLAFEMSGLHLFEWNIETKTLIRSKKVTEIDDLGTRVPNVPESLIEKGMIHPDYIDDYRRAYKELEAGIDSVVMVKKLGKDDRFHWLRIDYKVVTDGDGNPVKAIGFGEDLDEVQEQQVRIRENIRAASEQFMSTSGNWIRFDLETDQMLECAENLSKIHVGESYSDMIDKMEKFFVYEDDREHFLQNISLEALKEFYRQGMFCDTFTYRFYDANRGVHWREVNYDMSMDHTTGHMVCFALIRDIDEKKELEKYIPEVAAGKLIYEKLYYKEPEFEYMVRGWLSSQAREEIGVFIVVDMDNFMQITKAFGETYSAEVARGIVTLLRAWLPADAIVGQFYADRFGIFIPHTESVSRTTTMVGILQKSLHSIFQVGTKVYTISSSVGYAFSRPGCTYEDMKKHAEEMMLLQKMIHL